MSESSAERDAGMQSGGVDEPVRYPKNHVVGILDSDGQVTETTKALTSAGFTSAELHVATGPSAAARLRGSSGRAGPAGLAIRIAERLGVQDDEMELKTVYEHALQDGRFVVAIAAPAADRKERAIGILKEQGAHDVHYFGRFSIEGRPLADAP